MTSKDEDALLRKIRELENKLLEKKAEDNRKWLEPEGDITPFDREIRHDKYVKASGPIGHDKMDTVKRVNEANENSVERAGLVKNTGDGSVLPEDYNEADRIPKTSIHEFDNITECLCSCHPHRLDCIDCYDHPVHLDAKRRPDKPESIDGYDEAKIMQLIEKDKAKTTKKHWYSR